MESVPISQITTNGKILAVAVSSYALQSSPAAMLVHCDATHSIMVKWIVTIPVTSSFHAAILVATSVLSNVPARLAVGSLDVLSNPSLERLCAKRLLLWLRTEPSMPPELALQLALEMLFHYLTTLRLTYLGP